jgi:ABC-type branched-subunit amino acid transport system ATPase component
LNGIQLQSITLHFKGVKALTDVNAEIGGGETTTILGPNGAGKTTLLNTVSGVYKADIGKVLLGGEEYTHLPMYMRARKGIRRTFQHVQLVPGLSVIENVMLGRMEQEGIGLVSSLLRPGRHSRATSEIFEDAGRVLDEVGIRSYANRMVEDLPFGILRMMEIARALVAKPRVLLMDEPAAGLSNDARNELLAILRKLKTEGITVILVEHNLDFVFQISDRIIVLERGVKIFDGTPDEVKRDQRVKEAYLG